MTHGPWIVFVDRASDAMSFSVLPAGRVGEIAMGIENGDDADLIAAAPDMLAALKCARAALDPDRSPKTHAMVCAALAKAERIPHARLRREGYGTGRSHHPTVEARPRA